MIGDTIAEMFKSLVKDVGTVTPASVSMADIERVRLELNRLQGIPNPRSSPTRKGPDIASATALLIGNELDYFHVTGTTTTTSISLRDAGDMVWLEFDGALTLTHNATSLILQGATNLTTAAGDVLGFVSEGGGNWRLVSIQRATGRQILTAARTYYVRTDGSDSNTGLVDSAGGAFLTIQKAVDVASALDNGGFNVTIQVGNGTYTATVTLKNYIGSGTMTLQGDTTTPANVLISTTSANALVATNSGAWTIQGFEVRTTTSGTAVVADGPLTYLIFGAMKWGAQAAYTFLVGYNAVVKCTANYTISGNASYHWFAYSNGMIVASGITITLSGTPAFANQFAYADRTGVIECHANTFSGSATGTRYSVASNAVIFTNGGGANYLPGNAAGSTATGGQYV